MPCAVPAGPGRPKAPFPRRPSHAPPRPQQWGRIFRINKTGIRIRGPRPRRDSNSGSVPARRHQKTAAATAAGGDSGVEYLHPFGGDSPCLSPPHPAPSVRPVRPRNFRGRDSASRHRRDSPPRRRLDLPQDHHSNTLKETVLRVLISILRRSSDCGLTRTYWNSGFYYAQRN